MSLGVDDTIGVYLLKVSKRLKFTYLHKMLSSRAHPTKSARGNICKLDRRGRVEITCFQRLFRQQVFCKSKEENNHG